jgi:hypothetical protein
VTTAGQAQLIGALDLGRPELAAVRAASEANDLERARESFADYMRSRHNAHWQHQGKAGPTSCTAEEKATADRALHHDFTSVNIPYRFPADAGIDWKFNPTAQPDSKNALNHEWLWQFNRMYHWPSLAHVYRATGRREYADELKSEIRSWIETNPVPAKAENGPYSRWRTIEAGIRMFNSWPETFFTMLPDREGFPDDVMLEMVDSMREHAEYLDKFQTGGNWKTMESNGLFHVGTLFPEFRDSAKWREDGIERQHEELGIQVYPDGLQRELAPGYHNVALKQFLGTLNLARLNHIAMPENYTNLMEKMFDADLYLCLPDRKFPNFNDSGRGDLLPMFAEGLRIYPEREDWRWLVTNGKSGHMPQKTSHFFPDGGFAVMRSGWDRNAICLQMDLGPYGTGHQHEDKLSFNIDAYGARLVNEAGVYTYDASPMRKYSLGPAAHNTVFIDGMGQNRRAGPASVMMADPKLPHAWSSDAEFDFVMGTFGHHEGERWGVDRKTGFIHTRRILFVKPGYFVLVDSVTPPAGDYATHKYESLFHLDGADASIANETSSVVLTQEAPKAGISILPLTSSDLRVRVVKGQTDPVMQGWLSDHTFDKRPIPTAIFSRETTGPVHSMYVFAPTPADGHCPVLSVSKDAGAKGAELAAQIKLRSKVSDRVWLAADGTVNFRHGQSGRRREFR